MTKAQIKKQAIKEYKQELLIKIVGFISIEALFIGGFIYNLI